jgi:hypothetical protein
MFFVSYLTGSDNTSDYSYVGIIRSGAIPELLLTKKSRLTFDSTPVKAFNWVLAHLTNNMMPTGVDIYHEGRCGRCGRPLTVPESISSGFGPECVKLVGGSVPVLRKKGAVSTDPVKTGDVGRTA